MRLRELPVLALAVLALLTAGGSAAHEMRAIQPIPTPEPQAPPPPTFRPIPRQAVERGVQAIFDAWNTPHLQGLLAPSFYDATKLPDELAATIPRDAILRLLSLQSMTTLRQTTSPGPLDDTILVVSVVTVTVQSQVEYEDAVRGYQRLPGKSDLTLEVRQVLPR